MRHFLTTALFLLLAALPLRAAEPNAEGVELANKVLSIFQAKCLDCHAATLARPKGKFGYVLDLKRVAANSEFVLRGHPEKSELYRLVNEDEMPGDDAKVPPLTKGEKETVRRWIELGAPEPTAGISQPVVVTPPTGETKESTMPFGKRVLRLIGRLHPASTHFPVALMIVAVLAEGLAWWTRREVWIHTVRFLVILAAIGAVFTAGLGWINASFTSYVGSNASVLSWHRWLGTGAAAWAVICAGLILLSDGREGSDSRQRFRGALILGALLVGVSGFLGSALIYGLDHYAW
jgi:uncharacterized membrane protein